MNICFLGLLFLLWCHLVFIMPHHMTPGRLVTQQKMQLEMSLESWRVEGAGAWEGHTQWALLAADHFLLPYVGFIWWYSMRYCDSDIYLRIYIYMYICRQIYTYRHFFSCSTTKYMVFIFNLPCLGRLNRLELMDPSADALVVGDANLTFSILLAKHREATGCVRNVKRSKLFVNFSTFSKQKMLMLKSNNMFFRNLVS